jgi:hypothetical protein
MQIPAFDILKRDDGAPIWIEAVEDLETVKIRLKELARLSPGQYIVFNQRTRQILSEAAIS